MPIKLIDLEKGAEKASLRGKTFEFLKNNSDLAYTLKEITSFFSKQNKNYRSKTTYKLIYNYLRDFTLKGSVIHKGNYYFYKKEAINEKKTRK